uniref:ER lumen protein-retaining receptor n=1 Tax=Octactis speculum TaxID=3111310 RepID=A0A7S2GHT0_9STRA
MDSFIPKGLRAKPSKTVVVSWIAFFFVSLLIYKMLSDGDFSFLLTYASVCRCFAFIILNIKMFTSNSASSVSLKTLEAYIVVFFWRLVSIMRHEGYLPYDSSGDWFYHVVEFTSLVSACVAVYQLFYKYRGTYDDSKDAFGNLGIPSFLGVLYIVLPCLILAVIFHPNLNKDFISDASWTFSMYLESLAILPQLYMFQKQASGTGSGVIEVLVSHSVFALGFARVVESAFWMSSFHELHSGAGSQFVGWVVLLSQFIHVALMGDFFYFYFLSLQSGTAMQLPTQSGLV